MIDDPELDALREAADSEIRPTETARLWQDTKKIPDGWEDLGLYIEPQLIVTKAFNAFNDNFAGLTHDDAARCNWRQEWEIWVKTAKRNRKNIEDKKAKKNAEAA